MGSPFHRPLFRDFRSLLAFLALSFIVAGLGAWITVPAVNSWYPTIQKPTWNPPNWIFGPVWTFLYALMSVSAWLMWRQRTGAPIRWPMAFYFTQLALNFGWTLLFFGLHLIALAADEIVLLWLLIVGTLLSFWPRSRLAALLLIPYLAWVSFAAAISWAIKDLNP